MLSGGGNDLQNGLENKHNSSIKQYDPDIALNDYLTQKGYDILGGIEADYRGVLDEVTSSFPEVKTILVGLSSVFFSISLTTPTCPTLFPSVM